jgi:hypothetical protein
MSGPHVSRSTHAGVGLLDNQMSTWLCRDLGKKVAAG